MVVQCLVPYSGCVTVRFYERYFRGTMKKGIFWGIGAGSLLIGLGILGWTARHTQAVSSSASQNDPCEKTSNSPQRPENCDNHGYAGGHVFVIPRSPGGGDDGRSGHGDSEAESAGHAGFGESASGHAGGGE